MCAIEGTGSESLSVETATLVGLWNYSSLRCGASDERGIMPESWIKPTNIPHESPFSVPPGLYQVISEGPVDGSIHCSRQYQIAVQLRSVLEAMENHEKTQRKLGVEFISGELSTNGFAGKVLDILDEARYLDFWLFFAFLRI